MRDPGKPCFVGFTAPAHCGIEPFDAGDWKATFPIGFRVVRGRLDKGDVVHMEVRPEDDFTWTRIAGRKEIKVCVRPRPGGPEFRLPDPLRLSATLPDAGLTAVSNPCVASSDLQIFFGDLYAYDLLSEAEGHPEEAFGWARDDRRFDFVAISP